jgi:hypothetical protein
MNVAVTSATRLAASRAAAAFGRSMADGPTERLVPVAARFR